MTKITVIPGDGIGPEIMTQVLRVLKAVEAPFEYDFHKAGSAALVQTGELLPQSTLDSITQNKVAIKGPITTPVGGGFRSLNVTLRQHFDLYANVRPVRSLPGVVTPFHNVNLVIVRENTEDLYTGIERKVDNDTAESIKRITRKGSERICRFAFELAVKIGKEKVAATHKANIMKLTDGMFLEVFRQVASRFPTVQAKDVIIDNCCMQLVINPQQFDIIVTENLYGDILSDLCAGLVGGLGVVPGANIGESAAIFEAVHGSAPDIAGRGLANPTALLLSAVMMLQYLNEHARAEAITKALNVVLSDQSSRTPDLGGRGSTESFTNAVLENL
jgi:isocitrate dehydrogenase (NAD+)